MHHKIIPNDLNPNKKTHARRDASPTHKIQVPTKLDRSHANISFEVSEIEKAFTISCANSTYELTKDH